MAPLPVTEAVAIAYVTKLAEEGVKEATVKNHLAGLRLLQVQRVWRPQIGGQFLDWPKSEGASRNIEPSRG